MKLRIIFSCILFLLNINLFAGADWKLAKEKDGIKGYTRDNDKTHYKEYKTVSTYKTTLSALTALYCDLNNHKVWMSDIMSATKIKSVSNTDWFTRYEIKFPWPMDNRDAVYHIQLIQDPSTKIVNITFTSAPDSYPKQKDFIRLDISSGAWKFTPKGNGIIEIETNGYTDPGNIPAWIVNMFLIESPMKTIMNMRKELETPQYKNAKVDFIQN
jgi:hypothetical protein